MEQHSQVRAAVLDIADQQNAHSMTLAMHAWVAILAGFMTDRRWS